MALVEFAIILPLFCLLLFGVIEFGMAFNDYQSLRHGARDSARNAVVGDFGPETVCPAGAAATGTDNTAMKRIICATKGHSGLGDNLRVRVIYTNEPGYADDKIKVCTARRVSSITGFLTPFTEGITLKTEVEMRVEKPLPTMPAGDGTYSTQEADPSGEGWSWCNA